VEVRPGEIGQVTLALAPTGASALTVSRWSLLAVGGALVVVGAVLAVEADAAERNLARAVAREPGTGLPTTDFSSVRAFDESGRAFAAGSIASFVVGGALAATGALLFLVGRKPPKLVAGRLEINF
jgi:hypothetical protein